MVSGTAGQLQFMMELRLGFYTQLMKPEPRGLLGKIKGEHHESMFLKQR
jgi:hypothetical protein